MNTRFGQVCLALIVLLLAVIATRRFTEPSNASAATPTQYKCVMKASAGRGVDAVADEALLNGLGKEGWQLVTGDAYYFILKR